MLDSARMEFSAYLNHRYGYGQSSGSVDPVLGYSAEMMYDHRDEDLVGLRMALAESDENICDNYDDIADNFAAEGLNEQTKPRRRGGRRHRSHFMKKPMALTEVILELLDSERRENALRCLSGHLIEVLFILNALLTFTKERRKANFNHQFLKRRETDDRFYRTAAYQLYFSCSTLAVLIQEVISVYERIYAGDLNVRGSKRLANVLTCFQEVWKSLRGVENNDAKIPNLLQPFILSTFTEEVYENIRAISLSVIDLTCKDCKQEVIQWALEADVVQACLYSIEIGSRLSKLIAMSILESILHDQYALGDICRPNCNLVMDIIKMLSNLAAILGVVQDFSRRLIFQVVRCFTLLCQHSRALELVKDNFPEQLLDHTFHELKKVYPLFRTLLHQLLLCIGKIDTYVPQASPSDSETLTTPSQAYGKENANSESSLSKRSTRTPLSSSNNKMSPRTPRSQNRVTDSSPLRPLDLNKEGWNGLQLPDAFHYVQP